jgi:hypothetical protein
MQPRMEPADAWGPSFNGVLLLLIIILAKRHRHVTSLGGLFCSAFNIALVHVFISCGKFTTC